MPNNTKDLCLNSGTSRIVLGALRCRLPIPNEMPRLVEEGELIDMLGSQFSIDPVEVAKRLVYTKAIDWAYEREWRVWFGRGRSKKILYEDLAFDPEELEAVYFGCRMMAEDRRDCTRVNCRLLSARKDNSESAEGKERVRIGFRTRSILFGPTTMRSSARTVFGSWILGAARARPLFEACFDLRGNGSGRSWAY